RFQPFALHHPPSYAATRSILVAGLRVRGAPLLLAMPRVQLLGNVPTSTPGIIEIMAFLVKNAAAARLLVIADVMLDRYWFGEVDRISPEAPVPVVRVARREDRLGGAANVARNIVALGAQATLMGLVGRDEVGEKIAELAVQ